MEIIHLELEQASFIEFYGIIIQLLILKQKISIKIPQIKFYLRKSIPTKTINNGQ